LIGLRQLFVRWRSKAPQFGFLAVAITAFAFALLAVLGASYLTYQLKIGRSEGGARQAVSGSDQAGRASFDFPRSDYRQSRFPRATRPLIGVNYTNYTFPGCDGTKTGILKTLHEPGVAEKVHNELLAMRRNGIATIRTIVWNITDASVRVTGENPLISSAGGTLKEPYRTNVAQYFAEVKRFGFKRLTISFSPQGKNNPILAGYDPVKFNENWGFIKTVRSLLERYGPPDTRIDLLNEGAPSNYMPGNLINQLASYIGGMYRRYVRTFGSRDVTVSLVAPRKPADLGLRLQNLLNIFKSRRLPQPRWYDVHIGYTPAQAFHGLADSDSVLSRNRLRRRLVVGETAYDDPAVARAIRSFIRHRSRRVDEVSPWYIRRERGCRISPPYDSSAYRRELAPTGG
jgi:hypothetical protein